QDELSAAMERIRELEARLEWRHSDEDESLAAELRARLAEVGAAGVISRVLEHSELLDQIVQTAMYVLGANAGAIYEVDEAKNELVFQSVVGGGGGEKLLGRRMAIGHGMAGWVAATGQAIAVADIPNDQRWAEDIGRETGYTPQTMICVPLILGDRVI